ERSADHGGRRAAQPGGAGDRLHHAADPDRDRLRGDPVVPRHGRGPADTDLGQHARRLVAVLPGGVVVRAVPRPGVADHHAGLQPARRRRAGRPGGGGMIRFLIRRILFGILVLWLISVAWFALFL